MKCPPSPKLEYVPTRCPQCSATTEGEAEKCCQQKQGMDGEYTCAGEFNDDGLSVQPTPESIDALNGWFAAHCNCSGECIANASSE